MAFQRLADAHQPMRIAPLEAGTSWVEVDDAADLERAREIACRC